MPCPKCGYVSFDHLDACKRCGSDLREEKRRRAGAGSFAPAAVPLAALPDLQEITGPAGVRPSPVSSMMAGSSDAAMHPAMREQESPDSRSWRASTGILESADLPIGGRLSVASRWGHAMRPLGADALPKGGIMIRAAAWIADVICLFLTTIGLAFLVLATIYFGGRLGGEINDQVLALAAGSGALIVVSTGFLYFTFFAGASGQTPGKRLFGLKIIRETGEELTYGQAFLRSIYWVVSLLLFSVGFLMIAFSKQKQGLHDKLARTYVVRIPFGP
jgi:uncharacterized RDD family membrane protein YckC